MIEAVWRWRGHLVRVGLWMCLVGGGSSGALAHDARPLSVSMFDQGGHVYRIRIHVPPSVEAINEPRLAWPSGCELQGAGTPGAVPVQVSAMGLAGIVACDAEVEGRTIGIDYPLFNPSISTVVRYVPIDGTPRVSVLPPDQGEWTVSRAPTRLEVARDYLTMGIRHIWQGADHLLFVVGLILLAGTGRRIFLVITGFTIAHSITLSLSALGVIELAVEPIEAAIALSILFLAGELLRSGPRRLAGRYPLLVSSSFGLLHGLGFAAALGEIGLPSDEIFTSLMFFNLGVEAGQIIFILPVVGVIWVWVRCSQGDRVSLPADSSRKSLLAVSYGLGALAAFWLIQRLAAF